MTKIISHNTVKTKLLQSRLHCATHFSFTQLKMHIFVNMKPEDRLKDVTQLNSEI
jgi:hypothetical protein